MDLESQSELDGCRDVYELHTRLKLVEEKLGSVLLHTCNTSGTDPPKLLQLIANPSPLGLLGFAMVSWIAGIAKITPIEREVTDGYLALTGIFVGGFAQLLTGTIHFAKNNAHSATKFSVYGLHWVVQGVLIYERDGGRFTRISAPATQSTYFSLLAVTTIILWIPTLRMNRMLSGLLFLNGVMYTFDAFAVFGIRGLEVVSGVVSCTAATIALYLCAADLINESERRAVLPIFPHKDHKDDYYKPAYMPRQHFQKSVTCSVYH